MNDEPQDASKGAFADGGRGRLLELLAVFFLFCAPTIFYFLTGGSRSSIDDATVGSFVADMLMRVGWCALVPLLLTRRDVFDWKLPKTAREWGKEFGWGLLLILAVFGCNVLIGLIVGALGIDDTTQVSEPLSNNAVVATFLMCTPIIGLHEELFFRVYAQTRLTQVLRSQRILPVLLASGVFAAVHGYSLAGTVMMLVFGVIMGTSYQANGKIPRLVIAHTLWNVGVTVLSLYLSLNI